MDAPTQYWSSLHLATTGYLGIGTTSPAQKLTVDQGSLLIKSGGTPTALGGLDVGASVWNTTISGHYAYMLTTSLIIADITNPYNSF